MPTLGELGQLFGGGNANETTLRDIGMAMLRRAIMQKQMEQASDISNDVPRRGDAFQWAPPARTLLPELPTTYQPPQYWNYGSRVGVG